MFNMLPMLIQLSEQDKRLMVALFIIFIILFVLVAYIGLGIKAIMRKHGKEIDTYMYDLCKAGLIKSPKDFFMQVLKREVKVLYSKTRWAFRVILSLSVLLVLYALIFRPTGGGEHLFDFFGVHLNNLRIILDWPRGTFFGIDNFIVDWPTVARWPAPVFSLGSIVTYTFIIASIYAEVVFFIYIVGFVGKLLRAKDKSKEVFSKDLDSLRVDLDEIKLDGNDVNGAK